LRRRTRNESRGNQTRESAPAAAAKASARVPSIAIPERGWLLAGPLALIALLFACRGAPLGTAVADDYSFLYHLRFHHPFDPFDSMGATFYWRPLSRQVYFSAVSGWLVRAPWAAATLNAIILLALFYVIARVARRGFAPSVAAALAVFPLLSEPARVLLDWPSGVQHLLASLGLALAVHEAVEGRIVTAALAALGGTLSHESAALAIPALPLIAALRTRKASETLRWLAAAALVAAVWGIGYAIARRHGVVLPPRTAGSYPVAQLPTLFRLAIDAALNLENLSGLARELILYGYLAVLAFTLLSLLRRRTREALFARGAIPLIALVAFVISLLPLGLLLPDWNAWRAWVPSLLFGVAVTATLGLCSPWLAGGWTALRLAALLIAPLAPVIVAKTAPVTVSDMSFTRMVRLQRTVDSAYHALTMEHRALPRGSVIRYWNLPRMVRVAFQDSLAVRVWYGDSSIVWQTFGGNAGLIKRLDAMIEFADDSPAPAAMIDTEAMHIFQRGGQALLESRIHEADSLFAVASAREPMKQGPFASSVTMNRAIIAFVVGDFDRADSLSDLAYALGGENADYWALQGQLAYIRGDRDKARRAVQKSLRINPDQAQAKRLQEELDRTGG
jgi:tetratricopeptide (TPR) repeat protein